MKIAMTTEGTYPYVHGGVSVWCDRLIRQLADVEFALYAISPGIGREAMWNLPDNVTSITTIELAATDDRQTGHFPQRFQDAFLAAFDTMLDAVLGINPNRPFAFLDAIKSLHVVGREYPLDVGLRSEAAFDLVHQRWADRRVGDRLDQMGEPSLFDVLEVTSSLARFLVPLHVLPEADIVHTTANGLCALPALAAKWTNNSPVLLTEHGVYLRERFIEAHKIKGSDRVKAFHLLFFGALNDATLKVADAISPVSDYNGRWERETGADPERIVTIYNGVDPESFPVIVTEPEIPTVSWVGRIDPLKDVVTLIESFAYVHKTIPEAKLRLFGPVPEGNEGYHASCVQAIRDNDLEDCVSFEGLISPVTGAFEAGHVVALSSISEGFPFTVIEAMMSGRATVSTDVGGVAEAVGNAGLLVPPRNPEQMGEALIRMLTDPAERSRLGKAARKRALSELTLDLMADKYRDLYTRMMPSSPEMGMKLQLSLPSSPELGMDLQLSTTRG